jgi:hypothetical protein
MFGKLDDRPLLWESQEHLRLDWLALWHNGSDEKGDCVVVYALWDLVTETLLDEGEDPATILGTMRELRDNVSPDIMPVFGLTEYHPAMKAHMSHSDPDEIEALLVKRVAARQNRSS